MAKDAARSLLDEIWGNRGFPVDPVWIARQLGIRVVDSPELPQNVSGALVQEPGYDPVILLSSSDGDNRKRFTCAHELGHYIHHVSTGNDPGKMKFIDFRDANSRTGVDHDEVWANTFAANLLMPEHAVKAFSKQGVPCATMAWRFDVSMEAMSVRLRALKLDRAAA